MKASLFRKSSVVLTGLLCIPVFLLAKTSLSDYQMRIHIYQTHWSANRFGVHAFGRANLFDEQGAPHGVEFTYDCEYHLMASSGKEAYPARWKKQGQSVDVIFGQIGAAPGTYHDCEFKVAEKPYVFFMSHGEIGTESAQEFLAKNPGQAPATGTPNEADVPSSANQHQDYWPY